jgi:hypothetical protein
MNGFVRQSLALGVGVALASCMGSAWAQNAASAPAADSGTAQPQHKLQMVPAQAQLDKTLDAKKAKQGEPVTAKLQQDVQIPDAQNLPKNTVLEGHVDQVEPSQNKSDSTVVVTFDKAKLKSGQELSIKATVMAISEPVMMQQNQGGGAPAAGDMPSAGVGAPSGGGGAAAGGSSGGSRGGATTSSAPEPSMPQTASSSGQQQDTQKGGVPGVTLKSDLHDQSSATFSSKGKNVHVPDGTQMEVAITVIPAGVKLQQ